MAFALAVVRSERGRETRAILEAEFVGVANATRVCDIELFNPDRFGGLHIGPSGCSWKSFIDPGE